MEELRWALVCLLTFQVWGMGFRSLADMAGIVESWIRGGMIL